METELRLRPPPGRWSVSQRQRQRNVRRNSLRNLPIIHTQHTHVTVPMQDFNQKRKARNNHDTHTYRRGRDVCPFKPCTTCFFSFHVAFYVCRRNLFLLIGDQSAHVGRHRPFVIPRFICLLCAYATNILSLPYKVRTQLHPSSEFVQRWQHLCVE